MKDSEDATRPSPLGIRPRWPALRRCVGGGLTERVPTNCSPLHLCDTSHCLKRLHAFSGSLTTPDDPDTPEAAEAPHVWHAALSG
jgi:hypothetical protein